MKKFHNHKGFTLIELLAAITILGILMIVAIPGISLIMDQSRKRLYVNTAKTYVQSAARMIASNEFPVINDIDTTYYIHIDNIEMEQSSGESPFAPFEDAYVVVAYNGIISGKPNRAYEYYWASKDEAGYRVDLVEGDAFKTRDIYINKERKLNNKAPIGTRNKIVIIDKHGNIIKASQVIEITREEADKCYSYEMLENNKTVKLTYYKKSCGTDVRIPGIIDGYTVTEIYTYTFYNMGLTSVVIPGSVTKIGASAFRNNKLSKVVLPEGLKTIDSEAFANNTLPSIYLPDGLQTIGSRSFKTNKITTYDIPNSVSSLGACAFCDNPIDNPNFLYVKSGNGYDYSRIRGYIGDLSEFPNKTFIIPPEVNGVPLKTIESSAFYAMGLTDWTVVIPDTVTTIGSSAFSQNSIANINMPSSLQTIGSSAFYSNRMKTLTIPAGVTSIGELAFNANSVTSGDIWIYKRTASGIDYSTLIGYSGGNRKNLVIPPEQNGVALKTIDKSALRYLSLTGGLTIPNSVNNIATLALALNNLSWVDNGDGDKTGPFVYMRKASGGFDKTTLLQYAGYNKSNVDVPSQIKTISPYAFYYSRIKGVTLPEGLTTIGNNAFELCLLNGSVTIPSTVTSIGANAFKKQITWTSMNGELTNIVNKTGKSFDWQSITGGPEPATFETGTVKNWYGNIEVTK